MVSEGVVLIVALHCGVVVVTIIMVVKEVVLVVAIDYCIGSRHYGIVVKG